MKKIERSAVFLKENLALFQCPVCKEAFQDVSGQGVVCANNHRFDLGKKGTLHLLLKGGQNEYDKAMLSSRKALADTGFFHPILDAILNHIPKEGTILDVGCGEGSHLHYLTEKGLSGEKIGFDISKDAIQLAAAHFFDDAFWCVADLAQSPFGAEQFDAILNIFSPSHYQEFNRVLKPDGRVYKVVPDADYLIELRELLYGDRSYNNQDVVKRFKEIYPEALHEHVRYEVELTESTFRWLVEMTPLTWGATDADIEKIIKKPLKTISVAVSLLISGPIKVYK
ncbi:methyltransferase domain-containing protein [Jeotgalibaca sp. A127]|uniref:methyltransferase domain-containing protein n=1 Tax=Jeotgalibaca sp. A127 TaxID=3457324 RepID=UPI003FD4B1A1